MEAKKLNFEIQRALTDEESAAFKIVENLQSNGFEAFVAGGAVRDTILGHPAHDIDIATAATPDEIQKIFPEAYGRGKAFGVMALKRDNHEFEIATFREDIGVEDHRRPSDVKFSTAQKDAERRDFTINGLFYNPIKKEIIDYVDGLGDLKKKIIRFIGEPEKRIEEDYLRLLRAVRFGARLDFKISSESESAIKKNSEKIIKISTERIRDELSKILLNENRENGLILLSKLNLLKEVLPELETLKKVPQPAEFHSEGDVWTHTLLALKNIGQTHNEELVWTVLLHDIAKPETLGFRAQKGKTSITFFDHDVRSAEQAQKVLERFKFSRSFIEAVTWAISQHMRIVHAFRGMSERKQKKLFCDPHIELLLELTKADLSASLRPKGQPEMEMYQNAMALREKFEKESSQEEKNQVRKFDLITGRDIMKILKISASPAVGKIKSEIEKAYLEGKINTRPEALKMIEGLKND